MCCFAAENDVPYQFLTYTRKADKSSNGSSSNVTAKVASAVALTAVVVGASDKPSENSSNGSNGSSKSAEFVNVEKKSAGSDRSAHSNSNGNGNHGEGKLLAIAELAIEVLCSFAVSARWALFCVLCAVCSCASVLCSHCAVFMNSRQR